MQSSNTSIEPRYDVVTLGETMIRLTPLAMQRLEMAHSVSMHVGGSESNTAVGLSRLGLKVVWLSRLTNNPLGRQIANAIQTHGVDTSHVCWTDHDRVGLYFLEEAKLPRGSRVIYDRRDSAMARMQPSDLPIDLLQPRVTRAFHTTGISLGLGKPCSDTVLHAMQTAKQSGLLVSFDVNYRMLLWDRDTALQLCESAMDLSDVIFIAIRDAKLFYAPNNDSIKPEELLMLLTKRFPRAVVVMTVGDQGAWAATKDFVQHHSAYKADPVERLGGGDAFSAGFLSKFVLNPDRSQSSLNACLQIGCAVAALKYTIPGDFPIVEKAEVQRLIASDQAQTIRR